MHPATASRFALRATAALLVAATGVHWGLLGYHESLAGAWQERAAAVEVAGAIACALAATR